MNLFFKTQLFISLLVFYSNFSFSQSHLVVGHLRDHLTHKKIVGASVNIKPMNGEIQKLVSDVNGDFKIPVGGDTYKIFIKHSNYKDTIITMLINQQDTALTIDLGAKDILLREVKVNSKKRSIQFDGEKMIVNNDFFRSTIIDGWEALGTIPGINLSNSNSLTLNGRSDVTILFNDQKVTLTSQQATAMLKGMQPNMIERIEIVTGKNAKYEAQGSAGIINIVTKRALADRYYVYLNSGLVIDKFIRTNHNGSAYFKSKKFSGYATAGITNNLTYNNSEAYSSYNSEGNSTNIKVLGTTKNRDLYLTSNLGFNYDSNSKNSFGFFANLNRDYYKSRLNNHSSATGMEAYELGFENRQRSDGLLNTINLNYMLKIDTLGSYLKVLAGRIGGYSKDKSTLSYDYNNSIGDFVVDNRVPMDGHQYVASLDMSKIINKKIKYDLGLRYTKGLINNSISYDTLRNGVHFSDINQSALNYRENIFAAYLLITLKLKKLSIASGVRYEETLMENDYIDDGKQFSRNFNNFFPSLTFTYNSTNLKSSFNINKSLQRPNFEYINNYSQAIDRYTYSEGNPTLSPSFAWDFGVNNYLFNTAFFNFGFSTSKSTIIKVIIPEPERLVNIIQPNNALDTRIFYLSTGATVNIRKSWDAQINFSGNIKKNIVDPRFYSSEFDNNWNKTFFITLSSSYALTKTLSINNYLSYNSEITTYQTKIKSNWQSNLSLSKVFPKNWKASVLVTDIFNSYRNQVTNFSSGYYADFHYNPNSTRVSLSVSYFFGKLNSSVNEDNSLNKDIKRFNKDKLGN